MRTLTLGLFVALLAACGEDAAPPPPAVKAAPLVRSGWLAQNRDAVLVVDMQSKREDYDKGHLPGAVHVTVDELRTEGAKLLLPTDELTARLGALGIDATTHVVVYDEKRGRNASWMWYALTQLGHGAVSILDEPFGELKLVTDAVTPKPKTYVARRDPQNVVDADWMKANVGTVLMLDARPAVQYTAEKPKKNMRGGHIEGAVNVPYTAFFGDDGRTLPEAAARAKLEQLVGRPLEGNETIAVYCNSYHEGSNVHFQLARLGFTDIKAFDASMKEWEKRGWPTKKGSQP